MRKLQKFSMALVLVFMLGTFALAGTVDTPPAPPPPEPITFTGIIETPPAAQSANEPTDPVVTFALTLLQSLLSAF